MRQPARASRSHETHNRTLTWRIFIAFLIIYPTSDAFRGTANLPCGAINLALLIAFTLFLLATELTSHRLPSLHLRPSVRHPRPRPSTTSYLLALFLILAALSTIHSVSPRLSLMGLPGEYDGLIPILAYAALFLYVRHRVTPQQHRPLIRAAVLGSVLPAIDGILQHAHGIPGIQYLARSTSFFCNADFFGAYIAILMILTLTLYLSTARRLPALGYLVILAIQFVAVTFSSTRSAWLGAAVGTVLFSVLALVHNRPLWKRLLIFAIVIAAGFILLNHQSHNAVASRASTIPSNVQQVVTDHNSNYAGSSRWYIWKQSLPLIEHHPLLGSGPDTFQAVFHPPSTGNKKYLGNQTIANANNAYVQTAMTLGIPACILMITLYLLTLFNAWRSRCNPGGDYLLSAGLISALVCYLAQAFFNMDVVTVAPLFWVLLGAAAEQTRSPSNQSNSV